MDNSILVSVVIPTYSRNSTLKRAIGSVLNQTYKNFDEICLVGHTADAQFEDMIVTQYYPVKALTREFDIPVNKRIGLFLDAENCWLSIHGDTTLAPDTTSPTIILDKIIGIKKPSLITAADYADITSLSVTQNGTYTAPSGTAYSPVTVDVQEQPWQPLQDGYSNFWFELTDDTLSPWLNFSKKNNDAVIDWGDGSGEIALDTLTPTHTYSKAGKYVVKVKGVTGISQQNFLPLNNPGYQCCIKYIELNSELTSFGQYALQYCTGLRKITFSDAITVFSNANFRGCASLHAAITLPASLVTVSGQMFYFCFGLQEVIIKSNVSSIEGYAFGYCANLTTIHIQATTPPTIGNYIFTGLPTNYIIYVPVGTGETYKAAAGWSAYSDHILEEGQTVTRAMQRKLDNSVDGVITENLDDIEREEER